MSVFKGFRVNKSTLPRLAGLKQGPPFYLKSLLQIGNQKKYSQELNFIYLLNKWMEGSNENIKNEENVKKMQVGLPGKELFKLRMEL